jgi:dihydrodipicolinate synthase/N-acetylneuraminate lyase
MNELERKIDIILSGQPGEYEGMKRDDRAIVVPLIMSLLGGRSNVIAGVDFSESLTLLDNLSITK